MSLVKNSIKDYFQTSSVVISSLSSELKYVEEMANAINESNKNGGKYY